MPTEVMPAPAKVEAARNLKTIVAIVLDKSGSMMTCQKETIAGLNQEIETIKKNANEDTQVFLTEFNHNVEHILDGVAAKDLLSCDHYNPTGSTKLFDAVGETIELIREKVKDTEDTRYLVTVMSDGEENSSTIWDSKRLAELIQELQDSKRWTFAYIGANVDLSTIRARTGINASNIVSYDATPQGTLSAFESRSMASQNYLRSCAATVSCFYEGTEHEQGNQGISKPTPENFTGGGISTGKSKNRLHSISKRKPASHKGG